MFEKLKTRIVLVEPSHPGNIGSAARAMKTMGFSDLVLVNPKRFPAPEAKVMAVGADDILEKAHIVSSLDDAITDCTLIVGTSARDRSLPWPLLHPPQAAEYLLQEESKGQAAILFGREDKGLKNHELQRCHHHVQIPANPEYSSLNLAAAVQVLCYQLRMRFTENKQPQLSEKVQMGYDDQVANSETMNAFFQHMDDTLHEMEFLNRDNPNQVMPRVRRLFNRARLDLTELNILRGILSKMQWHLRKVNNEN